MDKAIIIGTYEFIGFNLCTSMLEKGIDVDGIHLDVDQEDVFLEEKQLEIGRNANFNELLADVWVTSPQYFTKPAWIVISFFDFYIRNKERFLLEQADIGNRFIKQMEHIKDKGSRFVFFLPIQFAAIDSKCTFQKSSLGWIGQLLELVHEKKVPFQIFYLPTLYGKWQPLENAFQNSLLREIKGDQMPVLNEREWIHDAIYIDNAIGHIMNIMETQSVQECLLKNEAPDHWKVCADWLAIEPAIYRGKGGKEIELDSNIPTNIVNGNGTFPDGLRMQKEHLLRFLQ